MKPSRAGLTNRRHTKHNGGGGRGSAVGISSNPFKFRERKKDKANYLFPFLLAIISPHRAPAAASEGVMNRLIYQWQI